MMCRSPVTIAKCQWTDVARMMIKSVASTLKIRASARLACFITYLVFLAFPSASVAEQTARDYPTRPITVIVTYPPGGGADAIARLIAEKLSAALKQPVVVENRGGGAGNIGTRAAAKAAPDGYTLLLGHTNILSVNPSMYSNAGFDPRTDFAPIGLIAATPVVIMSHPSVPAKSITDLIALAKKEAGKLTAGVPVIGSGSHLASEMFKSMANVDLNIISYKGTGPLTNDLLGGHVSIGFNTIAPALGNIQAGTLRALGVASPKRSSLLPDVPTVSEAGLPGFEAVLRYGLVAPAGTPKDIIARLNQELSAILTMPDVIRRISLDGSDTLGSTPEEYAADIDREEKRWGAIVRRLKLKGG